MLFTAGRLSGCPFWLWRRALFTWKVPMNAKVSSRGARHCLLITCSSSRSKLRGYPELPKHTFWLTTKIFMIKKKKKKSTKKETKTSVHLSLKRLKGVNLLAWVINEMNSTLIAKWFLPNIYVQNKQHSLWRYSLKGQMRCWLKLPQNMHYSGLLMNGWQN